MKIVRKTVVRKYRHPKRKVPYKGISDCGTSDVFSKVFDHGIMIRNDPSERVHDLIMLMGRMRQRSGVIVKKDYSLKTGLNEIDNLELWRLTL